MHQQGPGQPDFGGEKSGHGSCAFRIDPQPTCLKSESAFEVFSILSTTIRVSSAIRLGPWSLFSRMRSKGSRFTLGVWGWSCVRQTLRNRSQPSAAVRNRPQPFARGRYGCASGKFCNRGHFWSFPASHSFILRGRRGTL